MQIVLRGEPTVGGHLAGHAPEALFMPLQKFPIPIAVGGVAALDQAIQNQRRGPAGKEHLVPVQGVPTALDDDVRMLLEEGNDLLRCGNLLSMGT